MSSEDCPADSEFGDFDIATETLQQDSPCSSHLDWLDPSLRPNEIKELDDDDSLATEATFGGQSTSPVAQSNGGHSETSQDAPRHSPQDDGSSDASYQTCDSRPPQNPHPSQDIVEGSSVAPRRPYSQPHTPNTFTYPQQMAAGPSTLMPTTTFPSYYRREQCGTRLRFIPVAHIPQIPRSIEQRSHLYQEASSHGSSSTANVASVNRSIPVQCQPDGGHSETSQDAPLYVLQRCGTQFLFIPVASIPQIPRNIEQSPHLSQEAPSHGSSSPANVATVDRSITHVQCSARGQPFQCTKIWQEPMFRMKQAILRHLQKQHFGYRDIFVSCPYLGEDLSCSRTCRTNKIQLSSLGKHIANSHQGADVKFCPCGFRLSTTYACKRHKEVCTRAPMLDTSKTNRKRESNKESSKKKQKSPEPSKSGKRAPTREGLRSGTRKDTVVAKEPIMGGIPPLPAHSQSKASGSLPNADFTFSFPFPPPPATSHYRAESSQQQSQSQPQASGSRSPPPVTARNRPESSQQQSQSQPQALGSRLPPPVTACYRPESSQQQSQASSSLPNADFTFSFPYPPLATARYRPESSQQQSQASGSHTNAHFTYSSPFLPPPVTAHYRPESGSQSQFQASGSRSNANFAFRSPYPPPATAHYRPESSQHQASGSRLPPPDTTHYRPESGSQSQFQASGSHPNANFTFSFPFPPPPVTSHYRFESSQQQSQPQPQASGSRLPPPVTAPSYRPDLLQTQPQPQYQASSSHLNANFASSSRFPPPIDSYYMPESQFYYRSESSPTPDDPTDDDDYIFGMYRKSD